METRKASVMLCFIICGLCLDDVNAQIQSNFDYHAVNGTISLNQIPLDTLLRIENSNGVFHVSKGISYRNGLKKSLEIPFNIKDLTNSDLETRHEQSLKSAISEWKPPYKTDRYYTNPAKITKSYTDGPLYRMAGSVYNFYIETKYPSISQRK